MGNSWIFLVKNVLFGACYDCNCSAYSFIFLETIWNIVFPRIIVFIPRAPLSDRNKFNCNRGVARACR